MFERSREHEDMYRGEKEESHMMRHMQAEHPGREKEFKWEVVRSHR